MCVRLQNLLYICSMDIIDKFVGPIVVGFLVLCAIICALALTVFLCRVAFGKRRK